MRCRLFLPVPGGQTLAADQTCGHRPTVMTFKVAIKTRIRSTMIVSRILNHTADWFDSVELYQALQEPMGHLQGTGMHKDGLAWLVATGAVWNITNHTTA